MVGISNVGEIKFVHFWQSMPKVGIELITADLINHDEVS